MFSSIKHRCWHLIKVRSPTEFLFGADMPYHQAAEPAWFSAAIRRELRHELDPIRQDIAEMRREVAAVHRMAAIVKSPSFHWFLADQMQTWNHSCGSGPDAKLVVVPFCSGEDPTKAPVSIISLVYVMLC
jgi:hypothetical protein